MRLPSVSDSSVPGQAVAANGNLWLLTGSGTTHTVHQLSLPQHSNRTGATLRDRGMATVTGPTALGTATIASDGTGESVVGLASPGRIQIFTSGDPSSGGSQTVRYRSPTGLDQILPVTDAQGRLIYLLHGSAGWYVLSVATDGSDLRAPSRVNGIDPTSTLATPAESDGGIYTMGTGLDGHLYEVGLEGTEKSPGIATYPLTQASAGKAVDTENGFADGYVVARGSRVIYDSAGHRRAVAIFTDSSHAPVVITKSDAVNLNAAGDAAALSQNRIRHIVQGRNSPGGPTVNPGQHQGNPHKGTKQPGSPNKGKNPTKNPGNPPSKNPGKGPSGKNHQPTNINHDCSNTDQTPYAPIIDSATPAARSVLLKWYYPRVNNSDCVPQTYVVTAQLISNGAPAAPGSVTVQNQEFVNLGGLFPSSQYSITVTAYLGDNSTPSTPLPVTTTAEGPPAPTGLTVTSDANGNWKLNWDSCGTIGGDCVTAASWQITPTVCDGRGLTSELPTLEADADPTTRQQPTATYPGSAALLGRGLSFQVLGQSADGTPGVLSAASPCVYSWSTPQTQDMSLSASTTDQEVTLGQTTDAKVVLGLGDDPTTDDGGIGAQISFTLTGGGTSQTSDPVTYDGTQTTVSATFGVVKPGAQYTATATITPGHGNGGPATVTYNGELTTRADWPQFGVNANCDQNFLECDLQVQLTGISSAAANGEHFSLAQSSNINCNGTTSPLSKNDFDPASATITKSLRQKDGFYGQCTVTIALVEDAPNGTTLVFGGTTSGQESGSVNLGSPTTASVNKGDFTETWTTRNGQSAVQIDYTGNAKLSALTDNWTEAVFAADNTACGNSHSVPSPSSSIFITVPQSCVNKNANNPFTIGYQYSDTVGTGGPNSFSNNLAGPAPTYQQCDPAATDFAAAWGAEIADGVSFTYTGDAAAIAGCQPTAWTYAFFENGSQICQAATSGLNRAPDADPADTNAPISQCADTTPPASDWTWQIGWVDSAGTAGSTGEEQLSGTPPTS